MTDDNERQIYNQIANEAAQMEWDEYQFFYDNALGYFGDLLLYSATSPSMLIYLDNVSNLKDEPNENYAREILELYTFGVDNRYSQTDIEQLARAFTGWSIRKVKAELKKDFPQAARDPYTTPSQTVGAEEVLLDLGPGWRYLKGQSEPTPDGNGEPTTAWAQPDFNPTIWATGSTGIGYDDDDDATELTDMRGNYLSVYCRREFEINPNKDIDNLIIDVRYDDGYVAYLNGLEVGRSSSMRNYGSPPAFDRESRNHEASNGADTLDLAPYMHLLKKAPEKNVLAFQVHNASLNSSDLSLAPRIVSRTYTEESIPEWSPAGLWSFRFDPEEHDTDAKVLFEGSPQELALPAGREGAEGVNDAIDVIDAIVNHPSTREFIVLKLINKFVSDEITLANYKDRSGPKELVALLDLGIKAWQSTERPGHIRTVMHALLDPDTQSNAFWSGVAYRSKIKSAIEFINSSVRALDADIINDNLPDRNEDLGMFIFEREEPDGFPESGEGWMDTQNLLERMRFSQSLAAGRNTSGANWDVQDFLVANDLNTPEQVIEHFNELFFQGHLTEDNKQIMLDFVNTDQASAPSPWNTVSANMKRNRLRDLIGFLLSAPDFQFQ
jgi:hypothetical protein